MEPITMSDECVRKTLAGTMTQVQRPVIPQPPDGTAYVLVQEDGPWALCISAFGDDGEYPDGSNPWRRCPYGIVGDRLWVRETWRIDGWNEDGIIRIQYRADGALREPPGGILWPDTGNDLKDEDTWIQYWIQSSDDARKVPGEPAYESSNTWDPCWQWEPGQGPCRWRSPFYMPKWASRITLENTDVRVERVQEISAEDVAAEGVVLPRLEPDRGTTWYEGKVDDLARRRFALLWDSINAKRGYAWESNPWVWAITFRLLGGNDGNVGA